MEPQQPVSRDQPVVVHHLATLGVGVAFATVTSLILALLWELPSYLFGPDRSWLFKLNWAYILGLVLLSIGITLSGLRFGQIGYQHVITFFGKRINGVIVSEGWFWILPFVMEAVSVDVREETLNVGPTIALARDNVPIVVDVSTQIRVTDPVAYLSINNPESAIRELIERTVRWLTNDMISTSVATSKQQLSDALRSAIHSESERRGVAIVNMFVTDVRMPEELERAFTRMVREGVDKQSDMTQILNLIARVRTLIDTGLSPEKALDAAQAETGKIDKVVIDGNASDILKAAGALRTKL